MLDDSRQQRGVTLKLPACRRQRRPCFIANEELGAERLLQTLDSRTDGRLGDMQSLSGLNEAATSDLEKYGRVRYPSVSPIYNVIIYRL